MSSRKREEFRLEQDAIAWGKTMKEMNRERVPIDKYVYLASAYRRIRSNFADETHDKEKYADIANQLELAGSTVVAAEMRKISQQEGIHLEMNRQVAETLRQALAQMDREKEAEAKATQLKAIMGYAGGFKNKVYRAQIGHYGGYIVNVPAEHFEEFKQQFPHNQWPREVRRMNTKTEFTPQGDQRFNTLFPKSNSVMFQVYFADRSKGQETLEHVMGPHPWPE